VSFEITGEIIMDVQHETNREDTTVTRADTVRFLQEE
jgi:hypothetical protein